MGHKVTHVINAEGPDEFWFWCPGCRCYHGFEEGRWTFNGDVQRPTFSPSLLVEPGRDTQCHLFVREGRIEFLSDCRHALAGQTVEMQDETELEATLTRVSRRTGESADHGDRAD